MRNETTWFEDMLEPKIPIETKLEAKNSKPMYEPQVAP